MIAPSYTPPQEDDALTILTNAAMHTHRTASDPSDHPGYEQHPAPSKPWTRTGLVGDSTITNQHNNTGININSRAPYGSPGMSMSDYNPAVLSARSMETLAFNPAGRQLPYMHQGYQGIGPQISQNYANGLGILNAESYDDGRSALRDTEARDLRLKQQTERVMPFGMTGVPVLRLDREVRTENEEVDSGSRRRKKPRIEAPSVEDEEESGKKARGRPRVDTKDETAADRRRTQIRMAQRAYRHRKETTISSLEKKVQDLRGTNEEMSNIFITLYDFAVSKGLLQREPEFGQQLQSTTERFLALAKASVADDQEENHTEIGAKYEDAETGPQTKGHRTSPKKRQEATPPISEPANAWGGYTVSKEDSPIEEIDAGYQQDQQYRTRQADLQIITRPTLDNASFPFDFMDLQQYRVEVPEIEDYSQNFFPQWQPPLPKTHSYDEFSFARRIHRGAMERAFTLVTSTDPSSKARFQKVFGFCLLYETKEAIEARLRRLLGRTAKETLQDWQAPFVHVGGAGTYYPMHESDINGELMPKFRTGYSMGPFSPSVARAQEIIEGDMKCKLPGFEGEFFDANDVEGYLRGRGLDIPPAADFVTGDLDLLELTETPSLRCNSSETVTSISPQTPRSPVENIRLDGENLDFAKSDETMSISKTLCQIPSPLQFASSFNNWDNDTSFKESNFIDPIFGTMQSQSVGRTTTEVTVSDISYRERRTVTINVKTLLDEILLRVVCLGRAPGFRPADVNEALIAAVKAGL